MGIYNFHTWLKKNFIRSYISIKENNIYEYIYIDVNYVLHNSIYGCKTEKEFIAKLYMRLDIIFSNFIATKKIYLSLDGPASFAKILLQRKRRIDRSSKIDENIINSLYLTPGIEKMKRIENYLQIYLNKLKSSYKFINPEVILASSNDPDEGEIKICKQVMENGKNNLSHRHLIIGNDSDLIVLSMGMKPIYNINILVRGGSENELISLTKLLHLYTKRINRNDVIENLTNSNIRYDFVIISIMMGNDYLPKLGYIKSDKLWRIYYDLMISLHDDETLMNDNFTFNYDILKKLLLKIYNNLSKSCKTVTLNTYDGERAQIYLEGLLWCLKMYQQGTCPRYDYIYDFNSPHPFELLFYTFAEPQITIKESNAKPIPAKVYPLIIMPKKAMYLIPKEYHSLMNNELSYLYESEECEVCASYKNTFKDINKKISIAEASKPDPDNDEINKLKNNYKEKMNSYMKHKQIHKQIHKKSHKNNFNIDDIYKILKITNNI